MCIMTTELKNLYENLIDGMLMEEVAGLDKEILETLQGLPVSQKRMAILSILDKDRRLFMNIKKLVDNSEVSATEHIKDIIPMLRQYVEVGDFERKSVGEVQTPIMLVNDMLDTLPEEVWLNPELKWLDTSTGTGIFIALIIHRLMDGLKTAFPDDEIRYKHIVENMIHVSELQHRNAFLYLCAFDPHDKYAMNVYCGSFLEEGFDNHVKEVWGVGKFDVIVQNPPYQMQKPGFKKTQPLWHLFVEKSLNILEEGGYMAAVHPSGWRNVDGVFKNTQKMMLSKDILYLEMHDANDGIKTFGAATRYDFYCIKNTKTKNFITTIKCQDGTIENINLNNWEFIPNGMFSEIEKLLAKEGEDRVEVLHSYSVYETRKPYMSKKQSDEFKYPCVMNVNTKNNISCIWYSNTNQNGHFRIPKVIFGRKCSGVFLDFDGRYGTAQDCTSIVDNVEKLSKISKALLNKKFIKISKNCDFGGARDTYNRKIIALFRKDFWKEFLD